MILLACSSDANPITLDILNQNARLEFSVRWEALQTRGNTDNKTRVVEGGMLRSRKLTYLPGVVRCEF